MSLLYGSVWASSVHQILAIVEAIRGERFNFFRFGVTGKQVGTQAGQLITNSSSYLWVSMSMTSLLVTIVRPVRYAEVRRLLAILTLTCPGLSRETLKR